MVYGISSQWHKTTPVGLGNLDFQLHYLLRWKCFNQIFSKHWHTSIKNILWSNRNYLRFGLKSLLLWAKLNLEMCFFEVFLFGLYLFLLIIFLSYKISEFELIYSSQFVCLNKILFSKLNHMLWSSNWLWFYQILLNYCLSHFFGTLVFLLLFE